MTNFRAKHFRLTYTITGCAFFFIIAYLVYSTIEYQYTLVNQKGDFLSGFTQRSLSRIEVNPSKYVGKNAPSIGDKRMQLVTSYQKLTDVLADVPTKEQLQLSEINLVITNFRGLFSVSELTLIYALNFAGNTYYSFYVINPELNDEKLNIHLRKQLQPAIIISIILIGVLFLLQLFQISKVGNLVNELAEWSDNLSTQKTPQPPPQIKVGGMNYLAHTMNSSLKTFSHVLEKEKTFARFTSHELRTQVAVLSANMEILELIMKDLSYDEKKVLNRMLIAIEDMKYQTDALLWLSKETEHELEFTRCDVLKTINKAIQENRHIIENKNVKITFSGEKLHFHTHKTLLQIAINNLIRNAFQNTEDGLVHIEISEHGVSIINTNSQSLLKKQRRDGFGIGLVLIERIAERLKLNFTMENLENGRAIELSQT